MTLDLVCITKVVVICAFASVVAIVLACAWDQYKLVKNGWKKEDDEPWDGDDLD